MGEGILDSGAEADVAGVLIVVVVVVAVEKEGEIEYAQRAAPYCSEVGYPRAEAMRPPARVLDVLPLLLLVAAAARSAVVALRSRRRSPSGAPCLPPTARSGD